MSVRPTLQKKREIDANHNSSEADELRELLVSLYTPEEIFEWLWTPHQALGGASAMTLIFAGKQQQVLNHLRSAIEGDFT